MSTCQSVTTSSPPVVVATVVVSDRRGWGARRSGYFSPHDPIVACPLPAEQTGRESHDGDGLPPSGRRCTAMTRFLVVLTDVRPLDGVARNERTSPERRRQVVGRAAGRRRTGSPAPSWRWAWSARDGSGSRSSPSDVASPRSGAPELNPARPADPEPGAAPGRPVAGPATGRPACRRTVTHRIRFVARIGSAVVLPGYRPPVLATHSKVNRVSANGEHGQPQSRPKR